MGVSTRARWILSREVDELLTGMKYSRVVAMSSVDGLGFVDGKNGKPERMLRRKAVKREEGICSSFLVCCSLMGDGGRGTTGIPGETMVFETCASWRRPLLVGVIDEVP